MEWTRRMVGVTVGAGLALAALGFGVGWTVANERNDDTRKHHGPPGKSGWHAGMRGGPGMAWHGAGHGMRGPGQRGKARGLEIDLTDAQRSKLTCGTEAAAKSPARKAFRERAGDEFLVLAEIRCRSAQARADAAESLVEDDVLTAEQAARLSEHGSRHF